MSASIKVEYDQIQLRSETTGIKMVKTFQEVGEMIKKDKTIWKISFTVDGIRYRLVRKIIPEKKDDWINRPLTINEDGDVNTNEVYIPLTIKNTLIECGINF